MTCFHSFASDVTMRGAEATSGTGTRCCGTSRGARGSRTPDLSSANGALYQLSYDPLGLLSKTLQFNVFDTSIQGADAMPTPCMAAASPRSELN